MAEIRFALVLHSIYQNNFTFLILHQGVKDFFFFFKQASVQKILSDTQLRVKHIKHYCTVLYTSEIIYSQHSPKEQTQSTDSFENDTALLKMDSHK